MTKNYNSHNLYFFNYFVTFYPKDIHNEHFSIAKTVRKR